MRRHINLLIGAVAAAAVVAIPVATALGSEDSNNDPVPVFAAADVPLTNTFTYQGRLNESGAAANGAYDLRFTFYDAVTAGSAVGDVDTQQQTKEDVQVADGLFSVQLNGNGVFNGAARWLQIEVRPGNSAGTFTVLAPRQPVSSTPYAIYAKAAGSIALPFSASGGSTGALLEITNTGAGATPTPGTAARLVAGTALELDGALKVSGTKTAFIHTVTAGAVTTNLCAVGSNATIIDNPLTNGDAAAMLQVTRAVATAGGTLPAVGAVPASLVMYSPAGCAAGANKWVIVSDAGPLLTGDAFNVLVVKQ